MHFIQPKNRKAEKVDWRISEKTRDILTYYAEYTEHSIEEIVDVFLHENLKRDEQFIEWVKNRKNNKRMLKALDLPLEEESGGEIG